MVTIANKSSALFVPASLPWPLEGLRVRTGDGSFFGGWELVLGEAVEGSTTIPSELGFSVSLFLFTLSFSSSCLYILSDTTLIDFILFSYSSSISFFFLSLSFSFSSSLSRDAAVEAEGLENKDE